MSRLWIDTGEQFYRVTMPGFVCGVVASPEGRIIHTAPILSRFINDTIEHLARWVLRKGGGMERL